MCQNTDKIRRKSILTVSYVFPQRFSYHRSCRRQQSRSPLHRTHALGSKIELLVFTENGITEIRVLKGGKLEGKLLFFVCLVHNEQKLHFLGRDLLMTPLPITFPTSSWGLAAASCNILTYSACLLFVFTTYFQSKIFLCSNHRHKHRY